MKIAIDIRMITSSMHGISRYAFNLIKGLSKIDKINSYLLISNNRFIEKFISDKENMSLITTDVKLYGVLEQIVIPKLLKKNQVDIFHSPTYSAPIFQPCKVIMTIHDMIHIIFRDQYPRIHQYYYKYIVKSAAHKARRIITVSECSKNDISRLLDIPDEKIIVTYNSTEGHYTEVKDKNIIDKAPGKFNLNKRYILYIGNHKFHKNLERLMDAYVRLKKKGFEHLMVISGERNQRLLNNVNGFGDEIKFIGDISDNDLPALYRDADVCVMPSLYEGFGLPPLEAMACGVPVITSNVSSLPEIIGDAGIMVDPYSVAELTEAMERVLKDEALRIKLRKKGLAKAKEFTWDHVAKRTFELYHEVYSESKIGFNAQKYMSMNTGVGVYTNNISKSFLKVDKKNLYYIYSQKDIKREENFSGRSNAVINCSTFTHNNLIRILWEQFMLPVNQFKDRVDIFHYPDHTLCLFAKVSPSVITVHDLAFLKFPKLFNKSRLLYKKFAIERSFRLADFVIAVSNSTKRDAIDTFPFVKGKIDVVYLGVDKCYSPIKDTDGFRKRFNINSKIILFLGTLEPRKNIVRLIQAYKKLKDTKKIQHKLVIAGTKGWLYNQIFSEVDRLKLNDSVIFTGFINSEDLPYLYNCADVFVYPSLYEGFGLPPLEAMACGVPVITSNSSSLPEVVGDAGIMIDPYNIDELVEKIYTVISDRSLRLELRKKGIAKAKQFTWEKTARQTIKIYKRVLGQG